MEPVDAVSGGWAWSRSRTHQKRGTWWREPEVSAWTHFASWSIVRARAGESCKTRIITESVQWTYSVMFLYRIAIFSPSLAMQLSSSSSLLTAVSFACKMVVNKDVSGRGYKMQDGRKQGRLGTWVLKGHNTVWNSKLADSCLLCLRDGRKQGCLEIWVSKPQHGKQFNCYFRALLCCPRISSESYENLSCILCFLLFVALMR